MIKNFVLDTNVLIHNPAALFSFADNDVVLPITVIEELDRFKNESDRRAMHARQVLREVDALITEGALKDGATMPNGGRLKIAFIPKGQVLPRDMDPNVDDNKILAVALDLKKRNGGEPVLFVSKDVNARIKAYALGLETRDYEQQKVEYVSLYTGWRDLPVSDEQLAEFYTKKKLIPLGVEFCNNECARLTVAGRDGKPTLCRWSAKQKALMPIKEGLSGLGIRPRNIEQTFAFDLLMDDDVQLVSLVGQAGSGKTLIALACGLEKIMNGTSRYEKVLVARPVIPMGRDIGYMPGGKDQKLSYWMRPIFDNLDFILSKRKSGERDEKKLTAAYLQDSNLIEIEALTYIRGRSIPNQYFIVDEAQNLTPHELKTIISRAGEGTKIVLTGDPEQIDTPYLDANSNGLTYTVERLKNESLVGHVLLTKSERSALAGVAARLL
jgi:PhoH-like ATPase